MKQKSKLTSWSSFIHDLFINNWLCNREIRSKYFNTYVFIDILIII